MYLDLVPSRCSARLRNDLGARAPTLGPGTCFEKPEAPMCCLNKPARLRNFPYTMQSRMPGQLPEQQCGELCLNVEP